MVAYLAYVVPFILMLEGDVGGLDFTGLISALQGAVTAQQIITYMAAIVVIGIPLMLAWIFGRKAVRSFMDAVRGKTKGSI